MAFRLVGWLLAGLPLQPVCLSDLSPRTIQNQVRSGDPWRSLILFMQILGQAWGAALTGSSYCCPGACYYGSFPRPGSQGTLQSPGAETLEDPQRGLSERIA